MEYLWPPCSYLEPSGPSYLVESGGALIDVLPVHINVNGKALTVEELLTSKKDLHLAVFRYAAEELRRDLRGYTETVRARLGPEAKGEAEKIVEKLEKETWAMLSAHEATPVERYLHDETYRRLVSEMLSVRTHAMSALTFFLDCAAIDENGMLFISNATLHREYKAYLRRTLPAEHGEARERAAARLCRLDGLLDVSAAESDQEGLTPLMVAAGEGAGAATVELLLAAGSDVNAAPPSGWTALMQAAMSGDVPTILALCAAGASLEPRDREMGIGPLALASFNGHLAAAEALLAAGADMKARDKWVFPPITHAVGAGHAWWSACWPGGARNWTTLAMTARRRSCSQLSRATWRWCRPCVNQGRRSRRQATAAPRRWKWRRGRGTRLWRSTCGNGRVCEVDIHHHHSHARPPPTHTRRSKNPTSFDPLHTPTFPLPPPLPTPRLMLSAPTMADPGMLSSADFHRHRPEAPPHL